MKVKSFSYLFFYSTPMAVISSLHLDGVWTFLAVFFIFGLVPILDIIFPKINPDILLNEENKSFYKMIVYLMIPIHLGTLIYFLQIISNVSDPLDLVGMTFAMGISCGVLAFNMAHELGHRNSKIDQIMAQILLLSTLYMRFFIEHNQGHHKGIATINDPATAQKGENIYYFFIRSSYFSYVDAWKIENKNCRKKGKFSFFKNKMVYYTLFELFLIFGVGHFISLKALLAFLGACLISSFLLTVTNYIEHYGLVRKSLANPSSVGGKKKSLSYEKIRASHSWNSPHLFSNLILLNLGLHSDHHLNAGKEYPDLKLLESGPLLPTGHPGSMLISLIPALWFFIMDDHIK